MHAALSDFTGAERVLIDSPTFVNLFKVAQHLHVRPRSLPSWIKPGLLTHGLEVPINCLLSFLDKAMDQAYVQLANVVTVEAFTHLGSGLLGEADKDGTARLSVQTVTQAVVLIHVEEIRVRLSIQIVGELNPPMYVLLLTLCKLVLGEVFHHLVTFVPHVFIWIQLSPFLLVDVTRRTNPVGRFLHYCYVLTLPEHDGEVHDGCRLRAATTLSADVL
mmetsp:Transcript_67244/g.118880  ORF Transcript_67244/g.118880 Transcript_67244/m.118880 type:complete len:218 (-) Transcript_67244:2423-3076(-)